MISKERLAYLLNEEDTKCKSFYAWITEDNVSQEELYLYVRNLHEEITELKAELYD